MSELERFNLAALTYFKAVVELPVPDAQELDFDALVLRYSERDRFWTAALEAYKAISIGAVEGKP